MTKDKQFDSIFYTPEQVASMIGSNTHTVYRLIHAGKLSALKVGRRYIVDGAQINAFISANTTSRVVTSVDDEK